MRRRELAKIQGNGNTFTYAYNAEGLRTKKTVDGTATEYFLNGSQILAEKTGDTVTWFFYDSRGTRIGMVYGSNIYYYLYNLQGDVIALVRASTGKIAATYSYDAWGNCTVTNAAGYAVGDRNPFRYRGYYYDTETGLYYLNSRYYSPEFGRFISADDAAYLGADGEVLSYNLFAYCLNNPINRTDCGGYWSNWATAGVIIGSVLCIAAITILTCGVGTATLAGAVAVGAAQGALIGAAAGTAVGAGIGYGITGTVDGALEGAAIGFGAGAVVGAAVGGSIAGINYGTFSSSSELTKHYVKHGKDFHDLYSNAKGYEKGAKYVIKNGEYIPEKNAYIKFIGIEGKANYAFVGMKAGGRVSTYHIESVAKMIKDGVSLFVS